MALDGIVVRAIVKELQQIVGGRIGKIYQPCEHDILVHIRSQSQNHKLLLSAHPAYPRAHLTNSQYSNPAEAPMFCMLMRKHCEGAVIEAIRQVETERVMHIDLRQRNELGDIRMKRIVLEIMGRHSNLILTDPESGMILDGIHHVTPAISSYRIVLPGSAYVPPPQQDKANPLAADERLLEALLVPADEENIPPERIIVERFSGISPLLAKEIMHRSRINGETGNNGIADDEVYRNGMANTRGPMAWKALRRSFGGLMRQIAQNAFIPAIVEEEKTGKTYFSVIALTHIRGTVTAYPSVSECLEAYYGDKAERDAVKQRALDLRRVVANEKNKNEKKLEKLYESLEEAKQADQYRIMGELLAASLHRIKRGGKEAEVTDYYDEQQRTVKIPLDPLLSPSENAQRYFKKYNKLKNSVSAAHRQIASAEREIAYMDALMQQLDSASLADLGEIREELVGQGYLRDRRKPSGGKKKTGKPVLTCYISSEGIPIYVGKNNMQNEYLTNRLARPTDIWLHTKDIPGSHVVIAEAEYGEATLHEAAMLAAYYSKAKESSRVPVDYTLIRHVRKPNGAKPGFVIYERQKTLYVTPDEKTIKALAVRIN